MLSLFLPSEHCLPSLFFVLKVKTTCEKNQVIKCVACRNARTNAANIEMSGIFQVVQVSCQHSVLNFESSCHYCILITSVSAGGRPAFHQAHTDLRANLTAYANEGCAHMLTRCTLHCQTAAGPGSCQPSPHPCARDSAGIPLHALDRHPPLRCRQLFLSSFEVSIPDTLCSPAATACTSPS